VVLLTWLYLSSYVLLFGAELNSELEHQTAKDTTEGLQKPLGERGAWSADHVATEGSTSNQEGVADQGGEQPVFFRSPQAFPEVQQPNEHTYLTSRATARVGQIAGFKKVGMVTSILSTTGLALMRRKGREAAGATMLAAAAGIALMKRSD
jgi:membrane protein